MNLYSKRIPHLWVAITRTTRSLSAAGVLLSVALLARAQVSTSKPASIAGTVVKEPGSQPLKKVLLQIVPEGQKQGGNYTASTDADGHFHLENVTPGRYSIFLERTGFVGVNRRGLKSDVNVVTVQAGQSMEDLLFRMLPTAVIRGRISDEDGDPMSDVRVFALARVPGKKLREGAASVATNDLGEYRLAGLFPGQYWIAAAPPPDIRDYDQREKEKTGDAGNTADHPGDRPPDTRYVTTYYPGAYDAGQASTVMVRAGDDVPINIMLVPTRTYRVRGIVPGLKAGEKAVVDLVSQTGDSIRSNEVGSDGQFEVRGVAPGTYTATGSSLGADSQVLTARQEISVVAGDIEGVKLLLQSSFTLAGHLRFDGSAAQDLTQYTVNLRQSGLAPDPGFFISQDSFGTNAQVDRLGRFEWKSVNPGAYIIQVYGGNEQQNFFLKSAKLDGRDVDSGFTASGPSSLDLLLSSKGGTVEGIVVEREKDVDHDHPVPEAAVVAVPEEKYRRIPNRFGIGSTDQNGRFVIRGLPPGNYSLYAWQDVGEDVYRDPDFLESQEANGQALKVEEGSRQQLELRLSNVAEEWSP